MAQIVALVTKVSCNSITKRQDATLDVKVNYTYQGPAKRGRLGALVTQATFYSEFDEIGSTRKEVYVDLPEADTPRPLSTDIAGLPLAGCEPKSGYGIKVYALDLDGKPEWGCKNVLTVSPVEVELELLEVKIDPIGAGYVTVTPEPESGIQHNWYFPHGTAVYVTAHPNPGYRFKSWSGEMKDTTAITAPVYPMTEKRTITAHFEKEVVTPPKADIQNLEFVATKGTYDIGDRVPFICNYEYKGKAQRGQLVLSLGTGVYPTFSPVVNYAPMEVSFEKAMDWTRRSFPGTFLLTEALKPGQTYNTRAKLETLEEPTQETDTDWGVITISKVAPPPPAADIRNYDFVAQAGRYDIGRRVNFTATYEYKGRAQRGRLLISLGTGVYPSFFTKVNYAPMDAYFEEAMDWTRDYISGSFLLTEDLEPGQWYNTRAKLEAIDEYTQETDTDWGVIEIAKEPEKETYILAVAAEPVGTGYVIKDPVKTRYAYGEVVKLTAKPYSGWKFSYWNVDGQYADYINPINFMVIRNHLVTAHFVRA